MTDGRDRTREGRNGELVCALEEAVDPLDTVDPAAAFDDLDAVHEAVGDADVVGMGESSHGTREFFRWKHRLFRSLVEDRGVRLLGLEANFAATLAVNDFVVRGVGTSRDALSHDSLHESVRTESMLELVEWLRSFNDGRHPDDRVRVHGIDVQHSRAAAERLEAYFERCDPDVLDDVRLALDRLREPGFPDFSDEDALGGHLAARESVVATLGEALAEHEEAYVESTAREEYELAERLVWTVERGREQFDAIRAGRTDVGANVRIRDSAMAAQVLWLLRHVPADRMALWAHNAHLARDAFGGGTVRHRQGVPSLGRNLASVGSVDYYALGLTLGGGTVAATYVPEGEVREYEIQAPPEGSVPEVFGRVGEPAFFLDLSDRPADGALSGWLGTGPRQFDVVGGYEESPVNLVESDLRTQFDGLAFFEETTASRPLTPRR